MGIDVFLKKNFGILYLCKDLKDNILYIFYKD